MVHNNLCYAPVFSQLPESCVSSGYRIRRKLFFVKCWKNGQNCRKIYWKNGQKGFSINRTLEKYVFATRGTVYTVPLFTSIVDTSVFVGGCPGVFKRSMSFCAAASPIYCFGTCMVVSAGSITLPRGRLSNPTIPIS